MQKKNNTMLPSLYQLTAEHTALLHKLADLDLDAQTIADTIESSGLVENIAEKGAGYMLVARTFDQQVSAIDVEIDRLQALKKHCANVSARLKDSLMAAMQATGIQAIESPLMTIKIVENPDSVEVFEAALIPTEYMRQKEAPPPEPDKTKIKEALKALLDVPGCKLTRTNRLKVT